MFRFKQTEVPRQAGEFARLRVIKGPDVGATFVVKDNTFTVGRGDTVDIILADPKASRMHARLDYTESGWVVSDLGSANGIFFQGEFVRKFPLSSGAHFTLGGSVLEFLTSKESNRALSAPVLESADVEKLDIALAQQKVKVKNISKPVKIIESGPKKKTNPLLIVGVIAFGMYQYPEVVRPYLKEYGLSFIADYLPGEPKKPVAAAKSAAKTPEENRDLASFLPQTIAKDAEKASEQYFKQGFREYKVGHYLRAKESFELALQVNPAHSRAKHYIELSDKENEDEIKSLIQSASYSAWVGRRKEARGLYETAMRHLANNQDSPQYKTCENALKDLDKADGVAPEVENGEQKPGGTQ